MWIYQIEGINFKNQHLFSSELIMFPKHYLDLNAVINFVKLPGLKINPDHNSEMKPKLFFDILVDKILLRF